MNIIAIPLILFSGSLVDFTSYFLFTFILYLLSRSYILLPSATIHTQKTLIQFLYKIVNMIAPLSALLFASVALSSPILNERKVDALNEEATREAHVRDDTATRAFSAIDIKVSNHALYLQGIN